jgi:hypothetical protein
MTTKEQLQRQNRARRLLANGVPLQIHRDDEDAGLLMRQIGALPESCAFDLKDGRSGYVVNTTITVTQEVFTIAGITLELPWTDPELLLIEDPIKSGARYNHYWFPGNDTLAFERVAVINHFVRRLFRRRKTIEGLLLLVGSEPIPDAFVHGVLFPASVIVLDQYGNPYESEVDLWTDRSERRARDKQIRKSRPRLFSERDPSPVHSRSGADPVRVGVAGGVDRRVHPSECRTRPRRA